MADFTLKNNTTISGETDNNRITLSADEIEISGNLILGGDSGITIYGGGDTTVSKTNNVYTISTPTIKGDGDTTVSLNNNNEYIIAS